MSKRSPWVLMSYRIPREPSGPRIAVWRKLRQLGIAQLQDGLVALPLDARNREQLEWVAQHVTDAGGEASIWIAEPTTDAQERRLVAGMQEEIGAQYQTLIEESAAARSKPSGVQSRTLKRLRRELRRIRRRDYFPSAIRQQARAAVEELATLQQEPAP